MTYRMVMKQVIDTKEWYSDNAIVLEFPDKQSIWDIYHALIGSVEKQVEIFCYEIDDTGQPTAILLSYEWKNRASDAYYELMDLMT